jgi:hypothetical protein
MTKLLKFYLPLLFISLLVVAGVWYLQVKALDSGALSPGTMADDATVGDTAWNTPDNAKVSDDVYASFQTTTGSPKEYAIQIVKADGTIGATNKSTGAFWNTTEAYRSYGSSSDLWDETWDDTKINDIDFGVVISSIGTTGQSHYLKATKFGFSIPTGATINGILVEVENKYTGGGTHTAYVDHIRITVYYTVSVTVPLAPQQVIIQNVSTIIKGASMTIKAQ